MDFERTAHIATSLTDMGIETRYDIVRALRKEGANRRYVDRWQLPCLGSKGFNRHKQGVANWRICR